MSVGRSIVGVVRLSRGRHKCAGFATIPVPPTVTTKITLVHADKRGRWPWDDAYQGVRGGQPVLGTREPLERRRRVG